MSAKSVSHATRREKSSAISLSSASCSPCALSQAGHRTSEDRRQPSSLISLPNSRSLIAAHRLALCGRIDLPDDFFHTRASDVDVFYVVGAKNSLHHVVHGLLA